MTHALLLTDVVDSTRLSEQLGAEANGALWAEHDRVARKLLAEQLGFELERTDGIGGLFPSVDAALAFAAAYHAATAALSPPLVVRAALHAGDLTVRENPPEHVARGAKRLEVDGLGVAVAARVLSVCGGGATLLTADRPGARSRGHWRLKGVSEPVELFQVGDGDAPQDAAKAWRVVPRDGAWVPAREVPHHLPAERDPFVGRRADLRQLADLLDDGAHLVSVLGLGGTGKTRLVTRYGRTWLGDWPGGVWFCDLSEARSVDGIAYAVARALDVPLGQDDPVVRLGHAIAGRGRCLVLLDNFEQVARHAAETLGRWLDRAHEAAFVVTTREVLGLPGEEALALAPLPAADGAALFVARARSAKQDFEPDDVASIDALVKLLDGLPLAIELAAARVRVMPPKTLLERMSQRFKLLASSGGRHARQATLRGALDWSWALLSADEQSALAQVSVFEGGFTLEAAEGVLSLSELWPMDAVQALVDKSLVRRVSDGRFDLLVSVQEYASEHLEASGGRVEAETRHAAWFAQLGHESIVAAPTQGTPARLAALASELDNLVTACRRSVVRGAAEPALALLRAAWEVLDMTGPVAQALDLAERVAGMPGLGAEARAETATVRGRALGLAGRLNDAREQFDAAVAFHREAGDRRNEGRALGNLANVHVDLGRMDEAREHYDAALSVHREVGDRRAEGSALANLGFLHIAQGRMDEAREPLDAALAVHREVGNRRSEGNVLAALGALHLQLGRFDEARARYDAALAIYRELGDRRGEGQAFGSLGLLLYRQSRMDEAREHYHAALAIHREVGDGPSEGHVLSNLGVLHFERRQMDEAREHYDAALAIARGGGNRRFEGVALANLGGLHLEQGRLDEARAHLTGGERLLREVDDPVELAKVLCARARLEAKAGDPGAARAALTEAQDLAARLDVAPDGDLGQALAKARAALEIP